MTREEAHRILSNGLVNAPSEHEWCMAFEMAIKVLEQEPCEDCMSREAVLALKTPVDTMTGWSGYMIDALDVEQLPPVTPKPKTDVLDKIRAEIQGLRNCSCSCSDGIIDDVEDIIDKYKAESEE